MAKLSVLPRLAALALLVGTASAAQDPWSLSFKMAGGPTFQDFVSYTGNAGYGWGGDFEVGYQLDKRSQVAFSLGYRFYPGDFQQLSFAPATLPVRATPGTYTLETRIRKADVQGFLLGAVYRRDFEVEGLFWQGGLRIGFNKAKEIDTGTSFTQTVTTANSAGSITALAPIDSQLEKTVVSPGLVVGLGYRFNPTYSLEANYYMTRAESPSTGSKVTGSASELVFAIRF